LANPADWHASVPTLTLGTEGIEGAPFLVHNDVGALAPHERLGIGAMPVEVIVDRIL
jgi:hypothetical protein